MVYFLGQPFTLSKQVPQPIGFSYATNTDGVFYGGDKVQGADIASFTALSYYYAKDKKRVYYQSGELEGAATSTFEIIPTSSTGPNAARDAKFVHSEFTPLPLDPKSARVVGDNFLADDTAVYFTNTKVIGADPSTFTFLGFNYGVDAAGLWSGEQFVTNRTAGSGAKKLIK
jgi:DKNYY family